MTDSDAAEGQYSAFATILGNYWSVYGGIRAVFASPLFALSVIVTLICYPIWNVAGWWDVVLEVLPSILGVSLGAYAIFLAVGDEKFRALISGSSDDERGEPSPFIKTSAAFLHFVLLQFIALIYAILADATFVGTWSAEMRNFYESCCTQVRPLFSALSVVGWFMGFLLFVYGLVAAAAAALRIFQTSYWYDEYQTVRRNTDVGQSDRAD